MYLPTFPRRMAAVRHVQTDFRGYDHRPSCPEGGIYEMTNGSAADSPLFSTRPGRRRIYPCSGTPNGLFAAGDGLLWCAGTTLYYNGKAVPGCTLTDTPKVFAALGGTVLIWPDKVWFRPADGTFGSAETSWSGSVTLAGADTDGDGRASILVADGAGTDFRTGDAVTLSGFGDVRNNGTYILRGIDGARLRFDPDTFVRAGAVNGVTITRRVPDAQHACSYGNRLWACAHDSVWCTKLGDPLSWFWYEADENGAVATAAWSVDAGAPGDFSGCAATGSGVVFLKPGGLWRLYGTRPTNFQLVASAALGAEQDSGRSLVTAAETLYYLSPGGAAEHSFEPGIVTIHYNPDPVYGWTFDADGTWQGYKVSSKGACLHTGYGTTKNTVPATCGADGRIDTICANCGDVIATEVIPATGAHTWDNGTVTTEPTETTPGVRTFTCAVCSQTKTEVIPATGAHTFVFTKNVAPSCTEAGYDLYTCRDCGASEQRNVKPALGHKWDSGTVTTEPTETDPGSMTYTCTVCGATKTEVIPATGPHTHVWDEGTVTVAPTETTPGVRTYTCTVCGQTRTEIIPATGSAVCPGGAACPSFRFRDVPAPSNWAHEGIDYCVRHGLMSGFDATTFSPDTVSTRAQIVMILYNLSGDTTDYSKYYVPFTDVRPSTWYYNAVAWGYDKDIVAGMSTTTFAPDGLITREQMAVLLYGYTEKYAPAYLGGAASLNGFPDAASVSNWAYAAMSWAVGNGLISGIASNGADYLAPSGGATRAQIAAIMMRYCRLTGL